MSVCLSIVQIASFLHRITSSSATFLGLPSRSFATTAPQLKICDFSGGSFEDFEALLMQRRHNCSPAASFANCVMTLHLLKVHPQTFLSIPVTQKCQILSCDTLVANERYFFTLFYKGQNFRKNCTYYKIVCSALLAEKISHSKKNSATYYHKCSVVFT